MIYATSFQNARARVSAAPAALTGGAHRFRWGWGCGPWNVGRLIAICVTMGLVASAAQAQHPGDLINVPSGQPVTLTEVLLDTDPGALWVRFRFLASRIREGAGAVTYDVAAIDMDHLCHTLALPWLAERSVTAERIVISLSSDLIALGASDAAVTQFFEFYRPDGADCVWEEY